MAQNIQMCKINCYEIIIRWFGYCISRLLNCRCIYAKTGVLINLIWFSKREIVRMLCKFSFDIKFILLSKLERRMNNIGNVVSNVVYNSRL